MSFTKISKGSFIPWLICWFVSSSRAVVRTGWSWTRHCSRARFGGTQGGPPEALASWESSFHTQKTYHPMLPARFQSLMTFVNHQPVCLHQQTLPTDTPINTKPVAIPFKRGSLKAPLCSLEENKISSLQNFKPLEIMQQKAFCCVSFGKTEPAWFAQYQQKLWFWTRKVGTFSIKSSTLRWNSSPNSVLSCHGVFWSSYQGC